MFHSIIVTYSRDIMRIAANVGFELHLIEPLGFELEEEALRRADLDYHDLTRVSRHADYNSFMEAIKPQRVFAITTKGTRAYTEENFKDGDGLPETVMDTIEPKERLRIPMQPNNRSLNLSNSVSIVVYEAWRQQGFSGGN